MMTVMMIIIMMEDANASASASASAIDGHAGSIGNNESSNTGREASPNVKQSNHYTHPANNFETE